MKLQKKEAIGENLLYVMVWTAIILVPVLNSQMMSELHVNFEKVLIAWRQIAPYFVIFALHNGYLAPRLMLRRKYGKYVSGVLLLVVGVFAGVYGYEEAMPFEAVYGELPDAAGPQRVSFTNLEIYWNVVLGIFMCGANTGIKLIYQSIRDEQTMTELKHQNLQAEMDYLKYQINPHFFMNTLNNIHALIDIDADSAKSAVIDLSKMMRYVLYDSGHASTTLERDLQFLRNYIELMRIRYTDDVEIRIDTPEGLPLQAAIPPLLLIVFVENAFKHGVSSHRPSFIHISIGHAAGRVEATIANSRTPRTPANKPGIGLENVRKRLTLIYGEGNYALTILPEEERFTVKLSIPTLHA
ncbi:sensor histidine kinase [Alistipes sp.]|uniref:sensor histidine kinase n=1 Tax=Alistipes sp. TaxID=1872444 RepID=UPI000E954B93|nr:histidine kinase [Alistipes sp.]HBX90323.1 regulator [Alistipes sp.]HCN14266.1 regulator [Alistipes sp.]